MKLFLVVLNQKNVPKEWYSTVLHILYSYSGSSSINPLKDFCKNGGRCRQGWTKNSCDCTMTSFIGADCTTRKLITGNFIFSISDL